MLLRLQVRLARVQQKDIQLYTEHIVLLRLQVRWRGYCLRISSSTHSAAQATGQAGMARVQLKDIHCLALHIVMLRLHVRLARVQLKDIHCLALHIVLPGYRSGWRGFS